MTAAPNAASMIAARLARERDHITREAADLAHMAGRLVEDVDRGITIGTAREIADAARRLELRALKVEALQDAAELYAADLEAQVAP